MNNDKKPLSIGDIIIANNLYIFSHRRDVLEVCGIKGYKNDIRYILKSLYDAQIFKVYSSKTNFCLDKSEHSCHYSFRLATDAEINLAKISKILK